MIGTIDLSKTKQIKIIKPDICPHCDKGISPEIVGFIPFETFQHPFVYVCFKCPICEEVFFAKYYIGSANYIYPNERNARDYYELLGGHGLVKSFPKEICDISPDFVAIYNDAYKAEQKDLKKIVGIGYRLAFEYLIKDYCVMIHSDKKEEIIEKNLSQCINEYLDIDIREITKRAVWLGNDYAHYRSKHPGMDIEDLKCVIDICVSKIEGKIKEIKYINNVKKL